MPQLNSNWSVEGGRKPDGPHTGGQGRKEGWHKTSKRRKNENLFVNQYSRNLLIANILSF